MKIYLDVCCLNRPFDDQSQDMVRLESEAIVSIFSHSIDDSWEIVGSEIINIEINQIPNPTRREKVLNLIRRNTNIITLNEKIILRAKKLEMQGIKSMDALHIASAENGLVAIFLTTDYDLIKKYQKHPEMFFVPIKNPVTWIVEMNN